MTEELLSVRDLSLKLGLSDRSLRRMVRSGQIPAPVKIGQSIRWRGGELDDWVRGGCKTVQPTGEMADA